MPPPSEPQRTTESQLGAQWPGRAARQSPRASHRSARDPAEHQPLWRLRRLEVSRGERRLRGCSLGGSGRSLPLAPQLPANVGIPGLAESSLWPLPPSTLGVPQRALMAKLLFLQGHGETLGSGPTSLVKSDQSDLIST